MRTYSKISILLYTVQARIRMSRFRSRRASSTVIAWCMPTYRL